MSTVDRLEILKEKLEEEEREIERLKELCNKYEEEHKTVFEEWKKTINIINELENWLAKEYIFGNYEELYRIGIMDSYDKLQELKDSDKE